MDKFHYLKVGLGAVLVFVGVKMLLAHSPYKLDTLLALAVVAGILAVSILASILRPRQAIDHQDPVRWCKRFTAASAAEPHHQGAGERGQRQR
jgi:predicted tellurium resistance membrane protein TerC